MRFFHSLTYIFFFLLFFTELFAQVTSPAFSMDLLSISGSIQRDDGLPLGNVRVTCQQCPIPLEDTNDQGFYQFELVPEGNPYTLVPSKDNDPRAGITVLDFLKIQRHILFVELIDSPFRLQAADVNNSTTITAFDLIMIQRIILGIDSTWNSRDVWSFNPPQINIENLAGNLGNQNFTGIKTGDVMYEEETAVAPSVPTFSFFLSELNDSEVEVEIRVKDFTNVAAFQYGIFWEPTVLQFESLMNENLNDFSESRFFLKEPGMLNIAWTDSNLGLTVEDEMAILKLKFTPVGATGTSTPLLFENDFVPFQVVFGDCSIGVPIFEEENISIGNVSTPNMESTPFEVSLVSNPIMASDLIFLNVEIQKETMMTLKWWTMEGRLYEQREIGHAARQTTFSMKAPEKAGIYFLQVTSKSGLEKTLRVLVN